MAMFRKPAKQLKESLLKLWELIPGWLRNKLSAGGRIILDFWRENLKVPVIAIIFGFLIGALVILAIGKNPLLAYMAIYKSVFSSMRNFSETIAYVTPLIFTGLAVAFAFRCGLFNIGAEGQVIVGMFATGYIGFTWPHLPPVILLPLAILGGTLAGALWSGLPGLLKARLGVHEVINTIMMNHIAFYLVNWLVSEPFKVPNYQATAPVPESIQLTKLSDLFSFEPASGHTGIFFALAAAVICYLILWRTTLGFEIRATGFNAQASEYAGVSISRSLFMAMLISGAFAGLGGALQTLGVRYRVWEMATFPEFGFNGIAVALIGKNHPAGVVLGAFLFGALMRSDAAIQMQAGVPRQVVAIIQAAVIFFVAADEIVRWLVAKRKREVVVHD
jgi:ABC-type uncharacterized transport system permease subunit